MGSTTSGKFSCDGCGKSYAWKAELAGRRVKCKCGHVVTVPAEDPALALAQADADAAPQPGFDDLYALAEGAPVAAVAVTPAAYARSGGGTCPSCGAGLAAGAVLCVSCGTNLKSGKKVKTRGGGGGGGGRAAAAVAGGGGGGGAMLGYASMAPRRHGGDDERGGGGEVFFHPVKDMYVPAGLIVVGTIMSFIATMHGGIRNPGMALFAVGVMTFINLALTVPAVLLTVRLFDLGLGPIGPGVLKIAACAIAPAAVGDVMAMIFHGQAGSYVGWCISYLITLGIFMKLLDMDFGEVLICSTFIFLLRTWAVTALLMVILRGMGVGGLPTGMFGGAGGGGGGGRITLSGEVDRDEDDSLDAIRARESDEDAIRNLHSGGVDGKPWIEGGGNRVFAGLSHDKSRQVITGLLAAGATEVRVFAHKSAKKQQEVAYSMIVVPPDDKGGRGRVFNELKSLAGTLDRTTPRDRGEKYWPVEFLTPEERMKELEADRPAIPADKGDEPDDDDKDQ